MKIIRKNTFETNSSSTHAIVIPNNVDEDNYSLDDSLDHDYGFGRQECRLVQDWDEKLAYVYIVLKDYRDWTDNNRIKITQKDIDNFKNMIELLYKEIAKEYCENCYFTPKQLFEYLDSDREDGDIIGKGNYGINSLWGRGKFVDHSEDFGENGFIERVLNDYEFLRKLIFNRDSYITVSGDEYRGYNIKTIGFEYDYKEGDHRMNEKGELPPKEWLDDRGCIKDEYWNRYWNEYTLETGEFWDKLREYEKENDVYLKGN